MSKSKSKCSKPNDDRPLVGVEVAALIGRSMASLYAMVKDGRLPPPRQLAPHRAVWLRSEVIDALRRLPSRTPYKPYKARSKS